MDPTLSKPDDATFIEYPSTWLIEKACKHSINYSKARRERLRSSNTSLFSRIFKIFR